MKHTFSRIKPALLLAAGYVFFTLAPTHADTNLIPKPALMYVRGGAPFVLQNNTAIVASGEAAGEANFLAGQLRAATGFALPVKTVGNSAISMRLDASLQTQLGDEGYILESDQRGVAITAATRAGLFYGGQTLRGLLPPEIMRNAPVKGEKINWTVPAVSMQDKPRFGWRGFMLDDSRHFFGLSNVKTLLDNMAARKLNILHWHLTDDEGWRVEIKSLPKLTEVGAWRGTDTKLPNVRGEKHARYGGFYTQDQIREIIAYAKARHIDIMPEIDLPGHAIALLGSYPEAGPKVKGDGISATGFEDNAISPVSPEALAIVDKIYDEVAALFPFEYIHIGGDEVNYGFWKNDPEIKAFMEKERLKNLHEVQVAFTKRLEGIVARKGKKLFGWNEILDTKLSPGTGIMAWTGTGPGYDAARRGFPVVMSPAQHSYIDMGYGGVGEPESHSWAGNVTLQRMYQFDPLGDGGNLSDREKARIKGVQAHAWAEFIRAGNTGLVEFKTDQQALEYKLWPRLLATSEIAWTPQEERDFRDFSRRLDADEYQRLANAGLFFRVPPPLAIKQKAGIVTIEAPFQGAEVRYGFDGQPPTATSPRYEGPFALDGRDAGALRARTWMNGRGSSLVVGAQVEPIGTWKSGELTNTAQERSYDATGNLATGGIWRATFARTGGDKPLRLESARVLVDGVAASTATASDIINRGERAVARFVVPNIPKGARVAVVASLAAPDGGNVAGNVTLVRSERLEPGVKVTSTYPAYQNNALENAGDWDDDTLFWIADYPKKGVVATWTFDQPVSAQSVSLTTGEKSGTKDQLLGGQLEISEDGTNFRKVADFTYGSAAATLPNSTKIKALRVVAGADQSTWVILRDPVLR